MTSRLIVVAAATLLVASCASSGAMRRARDAEQRRDYDAAVIEYTQAVRRKPNDLTARLSLDRAKLRASQEHFTTARRLAALGKLEDALVEYGLGGEMNPSRGDIHQEMATHA